jgi:para-aminobenzoate synthetase component 1
MPVQIPFREPQEVAAAWREARHMAWLDSAGPVHPRSRHSYLCADPLHVLVARDGAVRLDGKPVPGDPFAVLQRTLAELRRTPEPEPAPVPFAGGAIAVLGYELGGVLETLPRRHPDDLHVPDMTVLFFDSLLAFDRVDRRAWALGPRAPALAQIAARPHAAPPPPPKLAWRPELDRADYVRAVARVLEYIRAGDIFQANFTMRHLAERPPGLDPLALHLALRARSPAPFAAFVDCGDGFAVCCQSPERFMSLSANGRIETRPIKGTERRGSGVEEDMFRAELLGQRIKDRAENLMIVDLLRNDIGRVAAIGSVRVPRLFAVESFPGQHHLVSTVSGRLAPGRDAVDLLRATFPGGSVTGAPKIRAMQIIDELEAARRGPYCGSIGWFGFDGAMDTNIVIRTVVVTPERLAAQAGGGIVADSDPEAEYQEMLVKIGPLLRASGAA